MQRGQGGTKVESGGKSPEKASQPAAQQQPVGAQPVKA
jgi:hypothetical protein